MSYKQILSDMETYAKENDVPIIEADGLAIVIDIIRQNDVSRVLEIGTAIGYSASQIHLQTRAAVTSIERECNMHELAKKNINKLQLSDKIDLIHADALLFDDSQIGMFDCIYIDGAKSQYMRFLEKYISHLKKGGVVIFDNLLFHGYVFSDSVNSKSRNLKQLVRKLETFIKNIENNDEYHFELISEGDGIGVLYRKEEYEQE